MTADTHRGIMHVQAGEGQRVAIGPGTSIFKPVSADTANAMALWEGIVPPAFSTPPPHAHPQSETFYLLEGELAFTGINQDGPFTFRSGPGATVHIPGGAPHQFVNPGMIPARVLTITMPGGLERFFAEFAAVLPAGVPPDAAMADPRRGAPTADAREHQCLPNGAHRYLPACGTSRGPPDSGAHAADHRRAQPPSHNRSDQGPGRVAAKRAVRTHSRCRSQRARRQPRRL